MAEKLTAVAKIIDVQKSYTAVSPDYIQVQVCVECSAITFDPKAHYQWHRDNHDPRRWSPS